MKVLIQVALHQRVNARAPRCLHVGEPAQIGDVHLIVRNGLNHGRIVSRYGHLDLCPGRFFQVGNQRLAIAQHFARIVCRDHAQAESSFGVFRVAAAASDKRAD